METKRKRKPRGQRKREQIRRGAYVCFRERGYHDATVDAICQHCSISKGSFYWHYQSKQDVFVDILETWAREVMDELYEQFEEAMSQEDYLGPLTWALEREIHRGRVIVPLWLEFSVHARRDPEIQATLSKFYRRARSAIAEILRPALERRFSEKEIQSIAATIFGAYTGLVIQDMSDPERADAREMVRRFMGVIDWWLRQVAEDRSPTRRERTASTGDRVESEALEAFVQPWPEAVAARLKALRALVLQVAPEVDERVIQGWKVLGYAGDRGLMVSLKCGPDAVRLGFFQGASMPDPEGLLQGKGKQRRHVVVPIEGELDRVALSDLVEAALTLQRI